MTVSSINQAALTTIAPSDSLALRPVSDEQRSLIQAVKAINASEMLGQDNELTFVFKRGIREAIVRIVNRQTGEVVQQIPSEYVLRIAEEIKRG